MGEKNLLFVAAFSAVLTLAFGYRDCGSVGGKIINMTMVPPCGPTVCVLKSGTNVTLNLAFMSNVASNTLKASVHGIIGGVPFPFPLPRPDACTDSGVTCPLKAGETYVYTKALEVKKEYPRLFVDVKWELIDDQSKDVVCVRIPSKIE